jgi:hypothetical protein
MFWWVVFSCHFLTFNPKGFWKLSDQFYAISLLLNAIPYFTQYTNLAYDRHPTITTTWVHLFEQRKFLLLLFFFLSVFGGLEQRKRQIVKKKMFPVGKCTTQYFRYPTKVLAWTSRTHLFFTPSVSKILSLYWYFFSR